MRSLQFTLDLGVLACAFVLAYLLRFDFNIPKSELRHGLLQLPYVVLIQFVMLALAGVYAFICRYVGLAEVRAFINALLSSAIPIAIMRIWLPPSFQDLKVPLSVIFMDTILGFMGVLGLRVLQRIMHERHEKELRATDSASEQKKAVLLVGAGRAGMLAAKEILQHGGMGLEIKGFVDDDPNIKRAVLNGFHVLGTTQDLPRLVRDLRIDNVVISIAHASRREFKRILNICEQIPVKVRIIPALHEILQGTVKVSRIRDVQIEDLLGREPVQLIEKDIAELLTGKSVMVTGAGGSIGSELVRQVARFAADNVILVERAEGALFNVERELREHYPDLSVAAVIADIGDESRMRHIFQHYRPQVVIHAAAHKHVPMMEFNPTEVVKNNVLATNLLGTLAGQHEVEVFVLISTDKAVRPTSVMGASKRIAELVVQDLNGRFDTRYLAVRFGNVIGSAGSVIPIFREQIAKGGPVTVTHPDMVRYFMTIPEASQLVLQAAAIGAGGEIFVLDMGEPVRILDIAKETISLSGLKPFEDIDILFTGMRPGEKLFEELEITEELLVNTRHPKIFIGKIKSYPHQQLRDALDRLAQLSMDCDEGELRKCLAEILPEAKLTLVGPSPRQAILTSVGVRSSSIWARNTELVSAEQAS
jgi:FlaA1/EpsC-like NDP-sugar epimerase